MNRSQVVGIVLQALRNQLETDDEVAEVDETTPLLGSKAAVDSLGLVNIIIELEQVLHEDHGLTITVVDEKAMSERHSPFQTVGTLADYAVRIADEQSEDVQ